MPSDMEYINGDSEELHWKFAISMWKIGIISFSSVKTINQIGPTFLYVLLQCKIHGIVDCGVNNVVRGMCIKPKNCFLYRLFKREACRS